MTPNYYIINSYVHHHSVARLKDEFEMYSGGSTRGLIFPRQRFVRTPPPPPLLYKLETRDPVDGLFELRSLYTGELALFREDLVEAILKAGVDNIQIFDAELKYNHTGAVYKNYKAVNIVGLVDIADRKKSKMMGIGDEVFPDHIAEAHFDGSKADGALMFRMSANSSAIVIHERVRRAIEAANIPNMDYTSSGNWMG